MTMRTSSDTKPPPSTWLHIALWVTQVVLAVFFLLAGINHGFVAIEEAARNSPWITGIPVALARFIGFAELAGAIGLVLPSATRTAPWLTSLAAVGLALVMGLAVPFHIIRGEANVIGVNIVGEASGCGTSRSRRTAMSGTRPRSSRVATCLEPGGVP